MAVSVDGPAKAKALAKRLAVTSYPLYSDRGGVASRTWGVFDANTDISKVASFIIDAGGAIRFRHVGTNKRDRPSIDALIKAANTTTP